MYDRSPSEKSESAITASIGPMEQRAMRPKLFSELCLPPTVAAMPTPSAMINGTVIGPVVTPPESNARGSMPALPFSVISAQIAKSII